MEQLGPASATEQKEECRQRQEDEMEALVAIYGNDFERTARGCEIFLAQGVKVDVYLPVDYPLGARAQFSLHTDNAKLSRTMARSLSLKLNEFADAASKNGEECVWQATQVVLEQLSCCGKSAAQGEEDGNSGSDLDAEHVLDKATVSELCVVFIDHMNQPRTYIKLLRSWAQQLGLMGVKLSRSGTAANKHSKMKNGKLEKVLVLLAGSSEAISTWLTRLRTHYVDVNARGQSCKERKASVIARFTPPQSSTFGEPPTDTTWLQITYGKRGNKDSESSAQQEQSITSLSCYFDELGLKSFYEETIAPMNLD